MSEQPRAKKRSLRLSPSDSQRLVQLRERCDDISVSAVVGLALTFLHQQMPLDPELLAELRGHLEAEGGADVETTVTSITLQPSEDVVLDRMTLIDVQPRFSTNQLARLALLALAAADDDTIRTLRLMTPVRPRTGPRPKSLENL